MSSLRSPQVLLGVLHLLTLGVLTSVLGSAEVEIFKYGDDPEHKGNHSGTHWTYDMAGEDWVGKDAQGSPWMCLSGQQQSPVNLPLSPSAATTIVASQRAVYQLGSVAANGTNVGVANNGHSVQVFWEDANFAPSISITIQDGQPLQSMLNVAPGNKARTVKAVPKQFHFHAHSENLLGGQIFPLEAHMVSVIAQSELPSCPPSGCIVVTAVMYKLADDLTTDNAWLAPFFDIMPYKEGVVNYLAAGSTLDLQQLLPSNTSYMAFSGSLTTPPCTEGVMWLVFLNPQTVSVKQWRNFMKAVGDYNCTLDTSSTNSTDATQQLGTAGDPNATSNQSSTEPEQSLPAAPDGASNSTPPASVTQTNDTSSSTNSSAAQQNRVLLEDHSIRVASTGLSRHLAEVASDAGTWKCTKLGAGSNYRLPQPLNGRTIRIWLDVTTKKSYLPADAATAASAGAIAGIVVGVTLGAGLTAGFGYLGWRMYNKRRLNRLYKMGVSNNDMMMVQQEVERQWLSPTPGGISGAAGLAKLSRHSNTDIPL